MGRVMTARKDEMESHHGYLEEAKVNDPDERAYMPLSLERWYQN